VIAHVLSKVLDGYNLSETEMKAVMEELMGGKVASAQIGAFLTALRMKGETVEEITAAAKVMRKKVVPITISIDSNEPLVDTCGTGGDKKGTFNISTVSAFVIAGAGVKVAKHGNRSASSKCGSADLMQALGININIPVEKIETCIEKAGFGFLYAPLFHGAMKYVAEARKEMGIRTIFNMLGPLTNPAMASSQLLGVYDESLTDTFAMVLKELGCKHALIVHGCDGLDEITITEKTKITELVNNRCETYYIHPEKFGMKAGVFSDLQGGEINENVLITQKILNGSSGQQRDVVLLNSAAGLIAAGKAKDFPQGIALSSESIDSGKALATLQKLIKLTNEQ
jgi:anthranilate phosphoribosyltransferase